MNLIKTVSNKFLYLATAALFILAGCQDKKAKQPPKNNLFITTNAGSIYAFNIASDKLLWKKELRDSNIDELTYFAFYKNELVKSYLNATIVGLDRNSGQEKWTFKDKVSPDQKYYDYNFSEVRFVHFYQKPLIYQNAMVFANSHGEIKSVDIPALKENWTFQAGVPILCSPQVIGGAIFANIGYRILKLNAANGKQLAKYDFEEGSSFELRIDEDKAYLLTEKGTVVCLDENLQPLWTYASNDEDLNVNKNMVINADQILIGSNKLLSIDKKSGKLNWKLELKDLGIFRDEKLSEDVVNHETNISSVAATENGYVMNTHGFLIAVDKNGKVLQKYPWPEADTLIGISSQAGNCYVVTKSGKLYKMDLEFKDRKLLTDHINFDFERGLEDVYFEFN